MNRRVFIKTFGTVLGTLVVSHSLSACQRSARSFRHPAWSIIRQCWFELDPETLATIPDPPEVYRVALDELAAAGEIEPVVADQMQAAFWAADGPHISLQMCYATGPSWTSRVLDDVRKNLRARRDVLADFRGNIDVQTLGITLDAIAQDMAMIQIIQERALDTQYLQLYDDQNLSVTPEALQAARILVELLTWRSE